MTPPPLRTSWPSLAREVMAGEAGGSYQSQQPAEALLDAARAVAAIDIAVLDDRAVRHQLTAVQEALRLLEARSCRLTSALTSRAAAQARAATPDDDPRAGERAARDVRTELAEDLRLTNAQVRRAQRVGDRIDGSPIVAEALDKGQITVDHVQSIEQAVKHLAGDERRDTERQLIEVARTGSARDVRDAGVRLLSILDHASAVDEQRRQHARREATAVRGRDGGVRVHGTFFGLQGEAVLTSFHAHRRPDRPGERRTAGQRGADAFVDLCLNALGDDLPADLAPLADTDPSATDPSASNAGGDRSDRTGPSRRPKRQHRVAPHINVTIDLDTLCSGQGVAETDWAGPIPWGAIRDHLDGAGLTFIVLREQLPIAVTRQTRYVPAGHWKAIKLRDGGCVHRHCDLPANWCQVAHLGTWFKDGGKLSLDTAGLLCDTHHHAFDAGELAVTWADGRPIVHPPGDPP